MEAVKEKVTFKKYPAYKESGVEYLGDIPAEWGTAYLGSILEPKTDKGHPNYEVLSVYRDYGVIPKDSRDDNHNATALDTSNYKAVEPGDLVVNKMKAWQGSMGISDYKGIVSPAYITCKVRKDNFDSKYLHYLLRSHSYIGEYNRLSYGVRIGQWDMHYEDFKKVTVLIPSPKEQTSIANFLDRKTAKIDEAIAIKEQQIELLEERRQILVHKAVTRGLNPDVSLKPSGVDWIGNIPEHWEIKKIKFVTSKIGSGITPSGGSTVYLEEGIPLLRSQNIHFGRIDLNDVAYISKKIHRSMSNSQVQKGDVLLNITGGSIGRCHYVESNRELNVNQHVCIVRPTKEIETVYLNGVLASEVGQDQIWFFQQGGGREGLNFQAIKNFFIPLPPKNEQREISARVKKISSQLYNAISDKKKQIEKLKEFKTVLINSAVTGKIKIS